MITPDKVREIVRGGESLTIEFKGEERGPLPDGELMETVVCLANNQGGMLLIGVEDDGRITGLHPRHRTHPAALAAFIASRTVPPVTVEATFVHLPEGPVAVLVIPASRQPVSTSDGRLLVRHLDARGQPGCRPLYAYELTSWLAERGQVDPTALVLPDITWEDLDSLEFVRLRRMLEENSGDTALLKLSDEEIAGALGLARPEGDHLRPTLAGLLLVGKEPALAEHVPAHEVAFQVLRGTDVVVNEFRRWPLLRVHEWLMESIGIRNEEQELMIEGMRIGVPRYDRAGIREAINNALIHRDYARLGAVHVQLHDDFVLVSNPGGFVAGVTVENLLVVAPRPRNPSVADAFKRVGLVEKTGRGISVIYAGQLRNGRQPPSYARSTEAGVTVTLESGPADLAFVERIINARRALERVLSVPELLVLWETWVTGRVSVSEVAHLIQQDQRASQRLLQRLQQDGLVERFASGGRYLHRLGATMRGTMARTEAGPTISKLSVTEAEEQVMAYVRQHGRIQRSAVETLSGLSRDQAYRLLRRLVTEGRLKRVGRGRGAYYRLANTRPENRKD